jgi:hypothetical protein
MRVLACLFLAACLSPSPAIGGSFSRTPVEDVGVPFWCDWAYDWDERCHHDDTAWLPVGGVDDKVWRAALRFSLDALPTDAHIASARLELYFDGACVAPRRRAGPCANAEYTVDAHTVLSQSWTEGARARLRSRRNGFDHCLDDLRALERLGPDRAGLELGVRSCSEPGRLLKLAEEEENFGVSGPYYPSSAFGTASIRPRLAVSYTVPTTGLSP